MNKALTELIASYAAVDGINETRVDGLILYRSGTPIPRTPVCYLPTICVVANRHKRVHIGDRAYDYNPDNYLINAVSLPVEGEILHATPEHPYLGLSLRIDPVMVSELIIAMERHGELPTCDSPALISACKISERLESAFVRLLHCCQDSMDADLLSAAIRREIFYEVLRGEKGAMLRNSVQQHTGANRIAPVIRFIEQNFHRALDISEIASVAGMSSSTLHEHFKQATTLSPLQFVKSLRLHRARSLLMEGCQAAEACWQVGYNSPSQFSREFRRFFGESPRDVMRVLR
ncbi:MAG: AraC family transcriptional regulator [Marinobacterium sp.]|nr:AraC family transcriptional regulator [Marinobacterium sp.]